VAVDVVTQVEIARPLAEVADYAANPDHAPAWYENIASVEWKTPAPLALGSQVAFVAQFLGRRLAYTYAVVEWVAHERLVMRTSQGPFPMETTYTWAALGDGRTLMTLRNRGAPAGFSKLVAPMLSLAMKRANRGDLARLKQVLEAR
jgi:hypothetical protein